MRGGRDQRVDERVAARLRAVRDPELAVRVREVELHRLLGDPQLAGDPAVRHPPGREAEDLRLARRQPARDLRRRGRFVALDDVAAHDLAQQRAERDRVHRLRDHTVRAGVERLGHPGVAHVLGQQQHPGRGRFLGDVAQTRDHVGRAVRVVDQDDVGRQRGDLAAERRAAVETADDLEAGRLAQRETDRVTGQRVVGDDEQAPHGRAPAPRRRTGSRTIPFRMSNPLCPVPRTPRPR